MFSAYFVFPYFDHDAFMHHTMHALDAPELMKFEATCNFMPLMVITMTLQKQKLLIMS